MKLLKCKLCGGEVDVVGNDRSVNRKTKCRKCGYGTPEQEAKSPAVVEVITINRRRPAPEQ